MKYGESSFDILYLAFAIISGNTLQLKDYSKTDWPWSMFDPAARQKRRETVFPQECKQVCDLGMALAR